MRTIFLKTKRKDDYTVRQASNRYYSVLKYTRLVIYFSDDRRTSAVYAEYYNALGWRFFSGVRNAGGLEYAMLVMGLIYRVLEDVKY